MNITEEEIARRNEAIAAFMGWQHSMGIWWSNMDEGGFPHQVLYFHNEWNDLMPVVEKILGEWKPEMILGKNCDCKENFPHHFHWEIFATERQGTPLITRLWTAVSDYIVAHEKTANGGEPQPQLEGREGE
jgi:hypothetical protein